MVGDVTALAADCSVHLITGDVMHVPDLFLPFVGDTMILQVSSAEWTGISHRTRTVDMQTI